MVDNHFAERTISDWGVKTTASWSTKPKGKAVVFIHGFGGGSLDTFPDFNSLFRTSDKFIGTDVFFYGYHSRSRTIGRNANEFQNFLQKISKDSSSLFSYATNSEVENRVNPKEIVIVAHSIGAIISRRALLDADQKGEKWPMNCSLILFAPAHKGASLTISKLISGQGLPSLLELLSIGVPFFMPVLEEIKANKPFIKKLESDTWERINQGKRNFTIAKVVVWADIERIVVQENFCDDPNAKVLRKTNHTSVCKPNLKFLMPFEILVSNL